MSTPLERATLQAYKGLQAVLGIDVTISRGAASTAISKAVPGRSQHDVTSNGQLVEQVQSRDFLIPVSAYKFNDVVSLPQRGDRITEDSTGKVYAILAMGSEAQWRYTDQTELILRVHTKAM